MFTILPFLLLLPFPAPPTATAARCRRCCGRRLCRAHRPCVFRSPSNDEVRRRPDAGPDPSAEFSEKIVGKSIVRAPHLHSKEDAENGTSGEGEGEREVDEIQPMSAVLLTNQSPLSPQNRCWEAFVMALCPVDAALAWRLTPAATAIGAPPADQSRASARLVQPSCSTIFEVRTASMRGGPRYALRVNAKPRERATERASSATSCAQPHDKTTPLPP